MHHLKCVVQVTFKVFVVLIDLSVLISVFVIVIAGARW